MNDLVICGIITCSEVNLQQKKWVGCFEYQMGLLERSRVRVRFNCRVSVVPASALDKQELSCDAFA